MQEALASHHYLVMADVMQNFAEPLVTNPPCQKIDRAALKNLSVSNSFQALFEESLQPRALEKHSGNLNLVSDCITEAFEAAGAALPKVTAAKRKPWISQATMGLVEQRRLAHTRNQFAEERRLHTEVKKSAKRDKKKWLEDLAGTNSWRALRQLRGGTKHLQGKLCDDMGHPVSSECRADTFAKHSESVQWAVRPATLTESAAINEELAVHLGPITFEELLKAVKSFKVGKSSGPDGHPVEYWRVLLESGRSDATEWLLLLCNMSWDSHTVPQAWHLSRVACIYKKGNPGDCGNYRPINLLNAAYKIYAMILLKRLLAAGADKLVWSSQFGFRPGRSTDDALHCVRRAVERAWADRGGSLHLLALDWRKAFDSIDPKALLNALRRFGLPPQLLKTIGAIYSERSFVVSDAGSTSEVRQQRSGICQGCPLSPFLFVMVMTVIMHDAVDKLGAAASDAYRAHTLFDVLYADDTLILGCSPANVANFAEMVEEIGATYGMALHWDKTQAMSVCSDSRIVKSNGTEIPPATSLKYLGATVDAHGRLDSEVSRKLGLAKSDFLSLCKLWSHANISVRDKLRYFESLVVSRLRYGLSSVWLVTAQRRRLDGFHARCLRKILRVPCAFVSRVSNAAVLARAEVQAFSEQLLRTQLILLGKVARSPDGDPLRVDTFAAGTVNPQIGRYVRRLGRPRQDWTTELMKVGSSRMGRSRFFTLLNDASSGAQERWKQEVQTLFADASKHQNSRP